MPRNVSIRPSGPRRWPAVALALMISAASTAEPGADERHIVLRGGAFDPAAAAKARPVPEAPSPIGTRYGLVQFRDRDSVDPALVRAAGAEIIEYVPHNAYLVRWDAASRERLARLDELRYSGPFAPRYRISPALATPAAKAATGGRLELIGFRGDDPRALAGLARKLAPGSTIVSADSVSGVPLVRFELVDSMTAAEFARRAAATDTVMWIDRHYPRLLSNVDTVGPIQGNADSGGNPPTVTPIWDQGIIGTGQIVAVGDSGLDRNAVHFSQWNGGNGLNTEITDAEFLEEGEVGELFLDRKVVGYFVQPNALPYENPTCTAHGTHASGTVAADGGTPSSPTDPGYDDGDGMAPNAQILFQDMAAQDQCVALDSRGGYPMFVQAHKSGAEIISGSYGAAPPTGSADGYFSNDFEADAAAYDLENVLLVFAAGNGGLLGGIDHPGQAKSTMAVAALGHGSQTEIASFSSRGPAHDGRLKPDIAAPGTAIRSVLDNNQDDNPPPPFNNNGLASLSGTSFATPAISGGAALLRQYYMDGFYPSGTRTVDDAVRPTGALMKATLLNGTRTYSDTPAVDTGWGRIWLDNNLYFAGDDRHLRVWDRPNLSGLGSGETEEFSVQVESGQEFRATLVWFDPPAVSFSGKSLINDLDLEVEANGTVFRGNVFSGGESADGGTPDDTNPVEQVLIKNPEEGEYTVRVHAPSVPGNGIQNTDRQGYALVVSAAQCDTQVTGGADLGIAAGADGVELDIDPLAGAEGYQIYRAEGDCASPPDEFKFVGQAATPEFVDRRTQGGFEYAYRVRGVDGCGEGPFSACKSVVSQAPCTLLPAFDAASIEADIVGGERCGVNLQWSAGTTTCPGTDLNYNVYRSTDPFFTPGPGNLIASVAATGYEDLAVDSLTTFYYAVKAEDNAGFGVGPNSGNETGRVVRKRITTRSEASSPGDYIDDPDGVSFVAVDAPWQVSGARAATGSFSYHNADPGQTHPNLTCAYLTTPPLDLQDGNPVLSYDAWYNLELNWDGVVVEISTDGGQSWQDLPPDGGYPSDFSETEIDGVPINECGYPAVQGAFNGVQQEFVTYTSDLSAFAGETVQLRWAFSSDPALEFEGFYLDHIRVTDASTPNMCLAGLSNQVSGPWFNAGQSGHGWLIELLSGVTPAAPDRVNAYWYVYLNGLPVWLIGTGDVSGRSATLDVVMTAGADFPPEFASADVELIPWGTLRFDFDGGAGGTASWDSLLPEFGSGALEMVQLAPISASVNSCRSGSYFNSSQSGHGFVVEVVNVGGEDQVIVAWYVYLDGAQVWLFGQGPLVGAIAEVPMSAFSGADFPPGFDAADVVSTPWGTLTIEFTGPNAARIDWTTDAAGYSDGGLDVTRLTELKGHACP